MEGEGFNFAQLIPFAIFGAIAAGAWIVLEWFSRSNPRTEVRLEEIRDPASRRRRQEAAEQSKADTMAKMLEKATPALAAPLTPKNEKDASKLKLKLAHAGFRSEAAPTIFLGLKVACLAAGLFIGGGGVLMTMGVSQSSLIRAGLIAGVLFYLPEIVLFFISKKRKEAIFLGLPDALDLMVVCVEAGLGLDQAMRKVSDEMVKSHRRVAEEFALCNMHLQMGRARAEVLHELGERSGVDDLSALAAIIIQADKFGSSISQALRVQSESMRTRRCQLAEEKAAKTAVKLIFPLVIFIFPGIFVVLVGPAAITMVRQMLPVMGGGG